MNNIRKSKKFSFSQGVGMKHKELELQILFLFGLYNLLRRVKQKKTTKKCQSESNTENNRLYCDYTPTREQ